MRAGDGSVHSCSASYREDYRWLELTIEMVIDRASQVAQW